MSNKYFVRDPDSRLKPWSSQDGHAIHLSVSFDKMTDNSNSLSLSLSLRHFVISEYLINLSVYHSHQIITISWVDKFVELCLHVNTVIIDAFLNYRPMPDYRLSLLDYRSFFNYHLRDTGITDTATVCRQPPLID